MDSGFKREEDLGKGCALKKKNTIPSLEKKKAEKGMRPRKGGRKQRRHQRNRGKFSRNNQNKNTSKIPLLQILRFLGKSKGKGLQKRGCPTGRGDTEPV